MTDYAVHIRIFDPEPTDDLVKKRTAVAADLGTRFNKGGRQVQEILRSANDLAAAVAEKGKLTAELADVVEAALKKQSTAFVREGQEIQMQVCALLGAVTALEKATPSTGSLMTTDVFASALWSALSFQPPRKEPKVEALRRELHDLARRFVAKTGASARLRKSIPDFKVQLKDGQDASAQMEAIKNGAAATIHALRHNSAVDREELDLLWWVQADWSDFLGHRFTEAPPVAAALASGLEAGGMLRRMPGDAHLRLVLRHVQEADHLTLAELLAALGDDRERLAAPFADDDTVKNCPAVFPLLAALTNVDTAPHGAKAKRSLRDWAARALLESATLHVTDHVPNVGV